MQIFMSFYDGQLKLISYMCFNPFKIGGLVLLSLSDTEHGWAHSSNTVYSVIHWLTGTSIELQPCLGTI